MEWVSLPSKIFYFFIFMYCKNINSIVTHSSISFSYLFRDVKKMKTGKIYISSIFCIFIRITKYKIIEVPGMKWHILMSMYTIIIKCYFFYIMHYSEMLQMWNFNNVIIRKPKSIIFFSQFFFYNLNLV